MKTSFRFFFCALTLCVAAFCTAAPTPASPAVPPAAIPDPAKPFAGVIVGVDAGHGAQSFSHSYTGGTQGVNSKMTESDLNLKCAQELAKMFEDAGAKVIRTRTTDQRVSPEGSSNKAELNARLQIFEKENVYFFIAVHHNAGPEKATGHTAIFKEVVEDDHLYKALATDVNDALENVVPGPKRGLIKGDYHLTRETDIPGTIVESGFMTNPEFDALSIQPDYPKKEAAAIYAGALKFWQANKAEVTTLHDQLVAKRKANPRDPSTYTYIPLNEKYQKEIAAVVAKINPDKTNDPAKVSAYIENYKKTMVKAGDTVDVTGEYKDGKIVLNGTVSDRKYHDEIINALVAMKFYNIQNNIKFPKEQKDEPAPTPSWQATPAPAAATPATTP